MGRDRQNRGNTKASGMKREARWWESQNGLIRCNLCPHTCRLSEGKRGICGVRSATADGIELNSWGMISAETFDPIEKKPLYHFMPGSKIWSVGLFGCNLHCPFCQNYRISKSPPLAGRYIKRTPEELINKAVDAAATSIAFTYSEPMIHAEYLIEAASIAKKANLSTVLVTNGSVCEEAAQEILSLIDGVNVDLKSWSAEYYRRTLKGDLETVKRFIEIAYNKCWVELTTLIVPGDNDDEDEMRRICGWIRCLSADIPLHLSAYYPSYKYDKPPTDPKTLQKLAGIAREELKFVYVGNVSASNDTMCPECGYAVIRRRGLSVVSDMAGNQCPICSHRVALY